MQGDFVLCLHFSLSRNLVRNKLHKQSLHSQLVTMFDIEIGKFTWIRNKCWNTIASQFLFVFDFDMFWDIPGCFDLMWLWSKSSLDWVNVSFTKILTVPKLENNIFSKQDLQSKSILKQKSQLLLSYKQYLFVYQLARQSFLIRDELRQCNDVMQCPIMSMQRCIFALILSLGCFCHVFHVNFQIKLLLIYIMQSFLSCE